MRKDSNNSKQRHAGPTSQMYVWYPYILDAHFRDAKIMQI